MSQVFNLEKRILLPVEEGGYFKCNREITRKDDASRNDGEFSNITIYFLTIYNVCMRYRISDIIYYLF